MPRGRKRKQDDNSDRGKDEAAEAEKEISADEDSPVKKKKDLSKSLTFKIEHWNANQLSSDLLKAFPSAQVLINETKPRSKSFELTAVKEDGEELQLWTGIKKGPPRKLKFPVNSDLIEEAMKLL
ncbi:hypothetical protein pdam_00018863 [Pocillopora damicornis]|uniref:Selenoprotein H n=1 Tax=Pocillopora damicornis TaxID=46731 RepID=A0A3M6TSC7_POCDA|nr:hypothetical protein pdam_00018863 [Pocillopora damicornis]